MFRKLLRSINQKLLLRRYRQYSIGQFSLWLPPEHCLDWYQAKYTNYDRKLPQIATRVAAKYPGMSALDIGANIGDTAVALRAAAHFPIICVEGSPDFLPILARNVEPLGDNVHVVPCFVGDRDGHIDVGRIRTRAGTASIAGGELVKEATAASVDVRALTDIVDEHFGAAALHLIKIDTDGYDFQIIRSSRQLLANTTTVLFFEYDPLITAGGEVAALAAMETLLSAGFCHFVVYDNFGNFMFSISDMGEPDRLRARFAELNLYLRSSRLHGGGIYYADVCAFKPIDTDLFQGALADEVGAP